MVNKVQERIYAEVASALLTVDWIIVDIPEPLDFEICTTTETFGLEIRQIFVDTETKSGSAAKKNESKNIQDVSALAKKYYESGGHPISAKFLGEIPSTITEALVTLMLAAAPTYPGTHITIEAYGTKIFMTPLPAEFSYYSRWIFVNDRGGWLKKISTTDLQYAIDRKESKLTIYKEKYNNIDLLLVADRTFNSGKLIMADDLMVRNPGFRAIYFLSYPESIHQIG